LAGADFLALSASGHHLHETLGIGGRSDAIPHQLGVQVSASICVGVEPTQAYSYLRNLGNLPRFMKHLEIVVPSKAGNSRWTSSRAYGPPVEWDAKIINEVPNEIISWKSESNDSVESAGSIHFEKAPQNRGTIIRVKLQYLPLGGAVGASIAKLFGRDPELELKNDLRRLKQILETGEIATTEGQPAGGSRAALALRQKAKAEALAKTKHESTPSAPSKARTANA
jgi:uncharacterized membrane protein